MLPSVSLSIPSLLSLSMRRHIPVFKKIFFIILLMVIVKDLYFYLGGMPKNVWVQYILGVIIVVLSVYLFVVSLYLTYHENIGKPVELSHAFKQSYRLSKQVYLALFIYVVVFVALYYISHFIVYLFNLHAPKSQLTNSLVILFFFSFPFFIFAVMTFFAIPLTIIDRLFAGFAFKRSVQLVGMKNWGIALICYICFIAMTLLVDPATIHGYLLASYYLNAPFDLLVLGVFLPFFNNLVVYSLNDLKIKEHLLEKSH